MPYTGGAFGYTISDYYDGRQAEKDARTARRLVLAIERGQRAVAEREVVKPDVHAAFGRLTAYFEKVESEKGQQR